MMLSYPERNYSPSEHSVCVLKSTISAIALNRLTRCICVEDTRGAPAHWTRYNISCACG